MELDKIILLIIENTNRTIELVGTIVIPFEIILLMLIGRRFIQPEIFVNVICAASVWCIFQVVDGYLPFQIVSFIQGHALFELKLSLPIVLLHIIVGDLCFYIFHRIAHTRYVFMVEHSVHHSSPELNYTTNLRVSFLAAFYSWTPLIIPAFIGFHPALLFASFTLANAIPFFLHTTHVKKLGWIEWVFNTPSHHRVHHGKNTCYVNKNFGGMLIIWDRLFGTYAEEIEPVEFGVKNLPPTGNPIKVIFRGWMMLLHTGYLKLLRTASQSNTKSAY